MEDLDALSARIKSMPPGIKAMFDIRLHKKQRRTLVLAVWLERAGHKACENINFITEHAEISRDDVSLSLDQLRRWGHLTACPCARCVRAATTAPAPKASKPVTPPKVSARELAMPIIARTDRDPLADAKSVAPRLADKYIARPPSRDWG